MKCPRCGTDNRESARFCDGCGMALLRSEGSGRARRIPSPLDLPGWEKDSQAITEELEEATVSFDAPDATSSPEAAKAADAPADTLYVGALDPSLADIPDEGPAAQPNGPADIPEAGGSPSKTQEMPRIGEAADVQNKAYIAPDAAKKTPKMPGERRVRKPIIAVLIIAGVLLTAAALVGGSYLLQFWGGKEVPNVIGMKAEDATDKLEAAGFTVSQVLVKSDDVEGIVLRTTPDAGRRAEAGAEVVIDVTCARTVPDVIGLTQEDAQALLQQEGFENVEVTEEKSDAAAGSVIAVSPEPGVRSKAQAKIMLTVATPYVVPAVAGLPLEEAEAALIAEGFVPTTARVYNEEAAEGTVLGTDPSEGTQLPSGSEVCINIAKSRATEVVGFAQSWFAATSDYSINGMNYQLKHVEAVNYEGNDTCSFTVVMQPYETHSWFGAQPETRYGNEQRVSGTMHFSSDGQLQSIDPAIQRN